MRQLCVFFVTHGCSQLCDYAEKHKESQKRKKERKNETRASRARRRKVQRFFRSGFLNLIIFAKNTFWGWVLFKRIAFSLFFSFFCPNSQQIRKIFWYLFDPWIILFHGLQIWIQMKMKVRQGRRLEGLEARMQLLNQNCVATLLYWWKTWRRTSLFLHFLRTWQL